MTITRAGLATSLAHYGVVALPCRVRDPDRKGKVEAGVGHAQKTPLKGLRFETLESAQAYLDRWETNWADARIHGTRKRQVAEMFAEERAVLGPLPLEPFRYYRFGARTVHLDGCVAVEAAYYGAPPGWIGQRVQVQWNDLHVRLTYRGLRRIEELREILRHERILLPMGVLLDLRYFERDLRFALQRSADIPVSVLCADMDRFKLINDQYGHEAGDVVMKSYLQGVKQVVGVRGDAFRGLGDEVKVLLTGTEHEENIRIAEEIRRQVSEMRLEHSAKRFLESRQALVFRLLRLTPVIVQLSRLPTSVSVLLSFRARTVWSLPDFAVGVSHSDEWLWGLLCL